MGDPRRVIVKVSDVGREIVYAAPPPRATDSQIHRFVDAPTRRLLLCLVLRFEFEFEFEF